MRVQLALVSKIDTKKVALFPTLKKEIVKIKGARWNLCEESMAVSAFLFLPVICVSENAFV